MEAIHQERIQSNALGHYAGILQFNNPSAPAGKKTTRRLNLDKENVKNGLGRLVLVLIKLLHELLEKQAIRRMESGSLTDGETERLGFALMRQSEEIDRLRIEFGLEEEDLNLDLGPLGKVL